MAKSDAARSAEWRRRLLLKSSIFDDLNAERAARIRQAFPNDDRPEVRAVVEFFANYPRCQEPPTRIELREGAWFVFTNDNASEEECVSAYLAMQEVTSLPIVVDAMAVRTFRQTADRVSAEVAEMRALGLWGRL